jgi:hypothetical protein
LIAVVAPLRKEGKARKKRFFPDDDEEKKKDFFLFFFPSSQPANAICVLNFSLFFFFFRFFLQGTARTTCVNELGAELVKLQTGLTDAFFEQVVQQLKVTGTPFNRNRINNFDNNAECNNEINAVEKLLIDAKLTADAAEVKKCNVNCGNVKLASECVQEKQRAALRAQQALATGDVVTTADLLDRAHLPLFDRALNTQQQNTFSAVFDGDARNRQTIDGLVAGQIADAVLEGRKGNYQDYKNLARSVADAADKEVKEVVAAFLKELEKDKRITDALANLNALQNQKDGLLVKQAFDLAAKRKAPVALPVVIHARVSNIAAGQAETDLINALKAALGPETVLSASVTDPANAGKKQLDVAMGVDQGEIATQEHEFGFVCVKAGVNCQFVADVHKPLFDIAQVKKVEKADPKPNDPYNAPAPHVPHHVPAVEDSASSLFVAAGAVLAALAMFL